MHLNYKINGKFYFVDLISYFEYVSRLATFRCAKFLFLFLLLFLSAVRFLIVIYSFILTHVLFKIISISYRNNLVVFAGKIKKSK
jgi:hypothetical protein